VLDHGEEVGRELVVSGGDTTEVLQLGEEVLDQVTLTVEMLAEARFPTPVALRRDVGRSALFLDQRPDAVSVIGFICKGDGVWAELIEIARPDRWASARRPGRRQALARAGLRRAVRLVACQAAAARSRATRSRSGHIGSCRC
jgi:hypothetical protein